ncbi:hypothetical protein G6F29_009427 [Rhizopus arrhizus]|nr:hypothetical protein G6F33_001376 [Rhizopus arrhizus]KAG0978289.1 hypothetical protein G6F29_009427 [Rhizopus arrhizus]KAG1014714.1 hypothetical protein G6F27_000723 [Rhizopus arrhizus]
MRLRVRHADGVATLGDISSDQTILVLKQKIISAIGLSSTQTIQISGGYPPKTISDDTIIIQNSGLRDGDTLNVKIVGNSTPQEPPNAVSQVQNLREGVVQTSNGFLTLREMKDDNSCLFRSIGYVLCRDTTMSAELRHAIVERIKADPVSYPDIVLGQDRDKYIEWIQKPTSWGGAIEIDSIDVQTGRIDKFGEGNYSERVLIVYSGIHYDALALAPTSDSPAEFDQTRFLTTDDDILTAARAIADSLRKSHKYTDVANFTLRCEQCKTGLKGEKDAHNHAAATGHTRFVEYQ